MTTPNRPPRSIPTIGRAVRAAARRLPAPVRRTCGARRNPRGDAMIVLVVVLITIVFSGCSDSDGPTTTPPPPADPIASGTFDATGGTLDIPGSAMRLTVPAGAVDVETEIVVREAASPPAGLVGRALDLAPDGASFDVPLALTVTLDADDLPGGVLPDDLEAVTWTGSGWERHPNLVVDVGADGTGTATTYLPHFSSYALVIVPGTDALYGAYGLAADDVTAVGHGSTLAHYDGSVITVTDAGLGPDTRLFDGWASGPTDHLLAAWDTFDGHVYASSDRTTWTSVVIPPGTGVAATAPLYALDGDAASGLVVAVGRNGRIAVRDGGVWTDESYLVAGGALSEVRHLRDVCVLPDGTSVAVGDEVLLVRIGTWTETDLSAVFGANRFFLRGVWGRSASDLTAVGWEVDLTRGGVTGVAIHFDGAAWTRMTALPAGTPGLRRVHGDADEIVVVGDAGTILRGDGTFFAPEDLCDVTTETLLGVWATDETATVAVGRNGVLLHSGDDCAEVDDGSGTGSGGGDMVLDFDGELGDCETGWFEEEASFELFPMLGGECGAGTCTVTTAPGRITLSPGRLRVLFNAATRVEVDVENRGQPVSLEAWYAGEMVDVDARSGGSGSMTLVVEAPGPDEQPYLVYVVGCDVDVLEIRIFE